MTDYTNSELAARADDERELARFNMTNREHAEREITRRNGVTMAADENRSVVRVRFPAHIDALNAYDALFADVASVEHQADPRDLVIVF